MIECGGQQSRGRFEQAQGARELRVLFFQLLKVVGRFDSHPRTTVLDRTPTCPLVDRLGHRVTERVGDRPDRHPLHVMTAVYRRDAGFLEVRCPVDGHRRRDRPQLLRVGPCHLLGRDVELCCVRLIQQLLQFDLLLLQLGFQLAQLRLPLGELGLLLFELGLVLAELVLPSGELGLPLTNLDFPLRELGLLVGELSLVLRDMSFPLSHLCFAMANLCYLLGKWGCTMRKLGLLV